MSRVESAMSRLTPAPDPSASPMPPLPPPPDVLPPPPLEIPPQRRPAIREPDLPGEHIPISDGPRPATAATLAVVDGRRRGTAC